MVPSQFSLNLCFLGYLILYEKQQYPIWLMLRLYRDNQRIRFPRKNWSQLYIIKILPVIICPPRLKSAEDQDALGSEIITFITQPTRQSSIQKKHRPWKKLFLILAEQVIQHNLNPIKVSHLVFPMVWATRGHFQSSKTVFFFFFFHHAIALSLFAHHYSNRHTHSYKHKQSKSHPKFRKVLSRGFCNWVQNVSI